VKQRLRPFLRWTASQGPVILAFVLLAVATLFGAVASFIDERSDVAEADTLRHQNERLAFEQECRFELSTPVTRIQADKLDALALGLVAVVQEDDAALATQIERIRNLSELEQEALADREAAVETCQRRAEERFE
jgi:signal transduction histidine kinase